MLELAGIIILGIFAQWLAWRLKIPSILPLILIGLFVGPISSLFTDERTQWIQPIYQGTYGLFPDENLFNFVSLAIGIILFEGGLTLRRGEIKKVGPVIGKLISVGSVITFFGAGLAAHLLFDFSWSISFLFSALIIVTGPTVINPILRNIPLKKDVSAVLKWEGILIDPIGALIAVLVFNFISIEGDAGYTEKALLDFGKVVVVGLSFGTASGYALYYAIKHKWIPHYLLNVVALSFVLFTFVFSDFLAHESSLLSVVVMGMFLGNSNLPSLKDLLDFKETLSVLLISILFILLSANINLDELILIVRWETAILLAIIIFIIRPLGVFLSTTNSTLGTNEKLFISWVGPRGIVAAGIASLFGTKLTQAGIDGAEYITPLVFSVVLITVLLNATTARLFASVAGLIKKSDGVLIVGASKASRLIGRYLQEHDRHVVLADTNRINLERCKSTGLEAIYADIYSDDLDEYLELNDMGFLLAMTGNDDINKQAIERLGSEFGEHGSFRLINSEEMRSEKDLSSLELFSKTHDYVKLTTVARQYPFIHEIPIDSNDSFSYILDEIEKDDNAIAIFLKNKNGNIEVLTDIENLVIEKGCRLAYLGKAMDLKNKDNNTLVKEY